MINKIEKLRRPFITFSYKMKKRIKTFKKMRFLTVLDSNSVFQKSWEFMKLILIKSGMLISLIKSNNLYGVAKMFYVIKLINRNLFGFHLK